MKKARILDSGNASNILCFFTDIFFSPAKLFSELDERKGEGTWKKKRKRKNEIKKGMMEIAKNSKNKTKERKRKDEEKISSG